MKTVLITQDGASQIVLTAETPWEKEALEKFRDNSTGENILMFFGQYYECQGGFFREGNERSLIFRTQTKDSK